MIDEIVTLIGEAGKTKATINLDTDSNMYKVECERLDVDFKIYKFFMVESDAQKFAEEFAFGEKYGNV